MKPVRSAGALALLSLLLLSSLVRADPAPRFDRATMLGVDGIRPGQKGVGKSVFSGTRIESFGVTVLGVLRRADFNGDLILVRIDSGPPVSKGYGVVSGMSGSPVYIHGKLIGALAYTWSFSKKPVAGITPIAQMLEAYHPGSAPAPTTRPVSHALRLAGKRYGRAAVGTVPSESLGGTVTLVPIATPVLVSGGNPRLVARLRPVLEPLGLTPVSGVGGRGDLRTRMEPGAAVGARLVGGDLDLTAVGTVTYVKDGVVLAFGHPLASLGSTDVPLVSAYVHGIVSSTELSLKLASAGQTQGRFLEDRDSCIGGRLGPGPDLLQADLRVTDRDRNATRRYHLGVIRNRSLTASLLAKLLSGATDALGVPPQGTSHLRLSLRAAGLPEVRRENTYSLEGTTDVLAVLLGDEGGSSSADGEVAQLLRVLQENPFGEAKVTSLSLSVEMAKQRRTAKIERVFTPRQKVRKGEEVPVEIAFRLPDKGLVTRTETVRLPADCPPGRVRIAVSGGGDAEQARSRLDVSEPRADSLAQLVDQMVRRPRNDDLVLLLALPTVGLESRGLVLRDLPPAVVEVVRSARATRVRTLRDFAEQRHGTDWIVSGQALLTLTVEGEEKDKGGAAASPEYAPSLFEDSGSPLAGLLSALGTSTAATRVGVAATPEEGTAEEDSVPDEGEEAEMPSWDEVESAGERPLSDLDLPGGTSTSSAAGPSGGAGHVASVWRVTDPKEIARGKREGVAASDLGILRAAPPPTAMASLDRCLWSLAALPDGAVYAAAWGDGKVVRVAPDGGTSVALVTPDAVVQAMTSAEGTVYAAAAPSGTVYRLPAQGPPSQVCHLDAESVWALVRDARGDLWAGTGPAGRLYRVSPAGAASLAFTVADRHITALALAPDGTLYLGTSPLGKVYAVAPNGAVRSVFEVEKAAVQSLAVGPDGKAYIGTSPTGRVLRLDPDGSAQEVLNTHGKHVLSLAVGPGGALYAASGPEAHLFRMEADGRWSELPSPRTDYLTSLTASGTGLYLTAADTGTVLRLASDSGAVGRFFTGVRDAGAIARWGAVRSRLVPSDAKAKILTRSGGTAFPDSTWSDWQPAGETVASPPNRYLQARLELTAPAQVENLEISYLPANRAPEVTLRAPAAGAIWSGPQTIRWSGRDPDGDSLDYTVSVSADAGATWTQLEGRPRAEPAASEAKTETPAAPAEKAGRAASPSSATPRVTPPMPSAKEEKPIAAVPDVTLRDVLRPRKEKPEAAEDKDGEGEDKPKEAEAPAAIAHSATSLRWDTTKAHDGWCLLRVVASDKAANPEGARTAEAVSPPFLVDNAPPVVTLPAAGEKPGPPPDRVVLTEATSYLVRGEWRVDTGEWTAAAAEDGILDSAQEVLLLPVASLPAGEHTLEVRARDAAGNVGSASLKYTR